MITANQIAGQPQAAGSQTMSVTNPTTQEPLPGVFSVATASEIDAAVSAAHEAWLIYRHTTGVQKANFLQAIATEIEALGDTLIERACAESGLPRGRITGERGRTCNQLRLFADLVVEGSWVRAVIDEALPERQPLPRADIRKVSMAMGPVAIFTASNFPLAFSTAGGDTASALAAGCPVVVKAHPSHLGTNALIAEAIATAAQKCELPAGVFSTVQGGVATGQQLVQHPLIKAVGFTGSLRGGNALCELAQQRPAPIPVYAEMGSNNPIFILPQKQQDAGLASTLAGSVNLGAGQFCTNPGMMVVQKGEATAAFLAALESAFAELTPATMLNESIYQAYEKGKTNCLNTDGVATLFSHVNDNNDWQGLPAIAQISAQDFLQNSHLQEEVFGPFTLLVMCETAQDMETVATSLQGQLTATVMATTEELTAAKGLFDLLTQKVGRVIYNGVPTGVEVGSAMHHGGPYPATSNALFTSVGTDAIQRFVRPVSFQNIPDALLPPALQAANPLNILRSINGKMTRS